MDLGGSVPDASRSEHDEATSFGTTPGCPTPGHGNDKPAWSPRTHLQDIQEIIDKLAAVTQQLRHPNVPGSTR